LYYWHAISRDQINYWVIYDGLALPTKSEASTVLERAIQKVGRGYWELVEDSTYPPDLPLLDREERGLVWDWDAGHLEQPVVISGGGALVRKLKIEDWLEHPEPQHPKEVTVQLSVLRGQQ
jgi:hypothetical protein